MIFDHGGQALGRGIERRPFGHGPGLEHAVHFQAEVVMQAGSIVPLHTESVASQPRVT